jgi:hypothetical protein
MHKFGKHTLHSGGPDGPEVTSQKQAVAIMLSEKRKEAQHGGKYPESHFQGGVVSKSSGLHDASYAQGGSVLGRTTDFLKTSDRFTDRSATSRVAGAPSSQKSEEEWGKGDSKANPKGVDKSEKPIKPRR